MPSLPEAAEVAEDMMVSFTGMPPLSEEVAGFETSAEG